MLAILEQRIETARKLSPGGELPPDMQQTVDVYRAVKHMYQRSQVRVTAWVFAAGVVGEALAAWFRSLAWKTQD